MNITQENAHGLSQAVSIGVLISLFLRSPSAIFIICFHESDIFRSSK